MGLPKCPKDGERVYLTARKGEAVCGRCSTFYTIATRPGLFMVSVALVEKPRRVKEVEVVRTVEKEVVKMRCQYCGKVNTLGTDVKCRNCGADVQ